MQLVRLSTVKHPLDGDGQPSASKLLVLRMSGCDAMALNSCMAKFSSLVSCHVLPTNVLLLNTEYTVNSLTESSTRGLFATHTHTHTHFALNFSPYVVKTLG